MQELDGLENGEILGKNCALDRVRVTCQVLRYAVDYDVGAKLERLLEVRRGEGIVDDQKRSPGVGQLANGGNVVHLEPWIGGALDPDQAGALGKGGLNSRKVARVDLADLYADRLVDLVQDAVGAAIYVERNDDFVSGAQIGLENGVFRCKPRSEGGRVLDALELRQHLFEALPGWIVRARIAEPPIPPGLVLLVRCRLENRCYQRAGFRLRRLAGVNGLRSEPHGVTPSAAPGARGTDRALAPQARHALQRRSATRDMWLRDA